MNLLTCLSPSKHTHIVSILETSERPLCFIVFITHVTCMWQFAVPFLIVQYSVFIRMGFVCYLWPSEWDLGEHWSWTNKMIF